MRVRAHEKKEKQMEVINRIILSGELARDPELKETRKKTTILSFTLGQTRQRKNRASGDWEDLPREHFEVSMFGPRAKLLASTLSAGSPVVVDGELQAHAWEYQGRKYSRIEVVALNVVQLDRGARKPRRERDLAPAGPEEAAPFDDEVYDLDAFEDSFDADDLDI